MELYRLTTLYIIAMEIFLTLTVVKVLQASNRQNPVSMKAALIFGSWLFAVILLFGIIKVLPQGISSLSLFAIVLIGVALSGLFFYPLRNAFMNVPQELLLLPQAFRMFFGAGFIVEAVYGIMPSDYGVMDGILHITTAFLATTLAIYIARGCSCTKSLIAVNLFGLLDIVVVAAGIAFMILDQIGTEHNVFLAVFFAAPVFIWLHLISLFKVYTERHN